MRASSGASVGADEPVVRGAGWVIKHLFLVGFPAAILAWLFVSYAWMCLFPLGSFGDSYSFQGDAFPRDGARGIAFLLEFYYLLGFALLTWIYPRWWAIVKFLLSGIFCVFMLILTANGEMSGFLESPASSLAQITWWATGPFRHYQYLSLLSGPDPTLQVKAVGGLLRDYDYGDWIGPDPVDQKIPPVVASLLRNPDETAHSECLRILRDHQLNDEILQVLTQALVDRAVPERRDIAKLFHDRKPQDERILKALLAVIETDDDPELFDAAIGALVAIAPEDPRLDHGLNMAMERGDPQGAVLLYERNPQDPRVLRAFKHHLASPDPEIRKEWVMALGELKPNTTPEIRSWLSKALTDPIAIVRMAAAQALSSVGSEDVGIQRTLARALKDSDPDVREEVARALGKLHPKDREAQELILGAYRGSASPDDRYLLRVAVTGMYNAAPSVFAGLMDLVKGKDASARRDALELLDDLGPLDDRTQLALVSLLHNHEQVVEGYEEDTVSKRATNLLQKHELAPRVEAALREMAQGDQDEKAKDAAKSILGLTE